MHTERPMRRRAIVGAAGVAVALVVSSCGDGGDVSSSGAPDTSAPASTVGGGGATSETTAPAASPDTAGFAEWQLIEITDTAGETFTIAELAGRPVFVENFATWCSNCRTQLGATHDAAELAGDDAVFLALSVETDLDLADMEDYQKTNGFSDIRFAVMTPELLAAMDAAFGGSALNPPSTPKVAVAANGVAGDLVTGAESAEEILSSLGLR